MYYKLSITYLTALFVLGFNGSQVLTAGKLHWVQRPKLQFATLTGVHVQWDLRWDHRTTPARDWKPQDQLAPQHTGATAQVRTAEN